MEKLLCSITGVLLRATRLDHCVLAISFTERSNARLTRSSLAHGYQYKKFVAKI